MVWASWDDSATLAILCCRAGRLPLLLLPPTPPTPPTLLPPDAASDCDDPDAAAGVARGALLSGFVLLFALNCLPSTVTALPEEWPRWEGGLAREATTLPAAPCQRSLAFETG